MTISLNTLNALEAAIDGKVAKAAAKRTRTQGTVTRIGNDGTVYATVIGSNVETPMSDVAASVKPGDIVPVTIQNGKATIDGNYTDPSAGVQYVGRVEQRADSAIAEAERARYAADSAEKDAERAWVAANSAEDAATTAWNHADDAYNAAVSAQTSAGNANTYANAALGQLGVVQDVIGVLNYVAEHGGFVPTQDSEVVEGKVYFVRDAQTGDYVPVVDPQASALPTYYEVSDDYDDVMGDFIMAHLAVTGRGLWVLPSGAGSSTTPASGEAQADSDARQGSGYKMLLASDGAYIYDAFGVQVMKYGEDIEPSTSRAFHIGDPNSTSYILFTPAQGATPAKITIGGSVEIGSDRTLAELLAEVDAKAARGTGILPVTTAPTAYTTQQGGFTPSYRISLATVKTQAGVTEVLVGDQLRYDTYLYPVGYVSSSYVYTGARVSIKGDTGGSGASAYSYNIAISPSAIVRSQDGTLQTSSITLSATRTEGTGTPASYSGRFKIEESANGTSWTSKYTSSSNESSKTWTTTGTSGLSSTAKFVRCTLYAAGGTTTQLDTQTIPIVQDGADGDDAYTVMLTNEAHVFPAGTSAAISSSTTTTVIAYKGATAVTPTIGTITTGVTGLSASKSGTTITFTASTSLTTQGGTVDIPVTVDGITFTLKFSWSLALKGDDSVNYYLSVSPGAIVRDSSGTLGATSVSWSATSKQGAGTPAAWSGYVWAHYTTDYSTWTQISKASSAASSGTVTIPSTGTVRQNVKAVRITLHTASPTSSNQVDSVTVPVVDSVKGEQGETGPEAVVYVTFDAVDWIAGTATLRATLLVDGSTPSGTITYQWKKNGSTVSGATSQTKSIGSNTGDMTAVWSCVVSWSTYTQAGSIDLAPLAYAAAVAGNYIVSTGTNDVWVHSEGHGPDTDPNSQTYGEALPTTFGWRLGSVFELVHAGLSYIKMWADQLTDEVALRLGLEEGGHAVFGSGGMEVFDYDSEGDVAISVAEFGKDGARIGKVGQAHAEIAPSSFEIRDYDDFPFAQMIDLRDPETGIYRETVGIPFGISYSAGTTPSFTWDYPISDFTVKYAFDGSVDSSWTKSGKTLTRSEALSSDTRFFFTLETESSTAKYFTFGVRGENEDGDLHDFGVGGLSASFGYLTDAIGFASLSEGRGAMATGSYSHAEGFSTTASGESAHAEGYGAMASGYVSHAECRSMAIGDSSHSEGASTTARGTCSHVEGANTEAIGDYSHAGGIYTTAAYDYQTAIGKYNDNKQGNLFEIGNGTADDARSNAFEVSASGNVTISGSHYLPYGTQIWDNSNGNCHMLLPEIGTAQAEYSFEGGGLYVRKRTRTSTSAAWGSWSSWTLIS